jgi:hypothetical protein
MIGGFDGIESETTSCKLVIVKDRQDQGSRHVDCGPETAGCQAEV